MILNMLNMMILNLLNKEILNVLNLKVNWRKVENFLLAVLEILTDCVSIFVCLFLIREVRDGRGPITVYWYDTIMPIVSCIWWLDNMSCDVLYSVKTLNSPCYTSLSKLYRVIGKIHNDSVGNYRDHKTNSRRAAASCLPAGLPSGRGWCPWPGATPSGCTWWAPASPSSHPTGSQSSPSQSWSADTGR